MQSRETKEEGRKRGRGGGGFLGRVNWQPKLPLRIPERAADDFFGE